jgi:hypothetical protein
MHIYYLIIYLIICCSILSVFTGVNYRLHCQFKKQFNNIHQQIHVCEDLIKVKNLIIENDKGKMDILVMQIRDLHAENLELQKSQLKEVLDETSRSNPANDTGHYKCC